ncbi:hypothetical protein BDV37DRAFT_285218 [Aspergillus pseudonomiae]|uniref:Zn(2)-C6 fungal-type domain-containing protein n=1 Tax=Aspergillus pseudonomiae TaxID=1506151 RepID=A0A5N7D6P8_9EURO|nr:uncharacterized protein BDV37DRAFT_285218 [Aspergillus pseudonomiae]KAE8401959.1 hypothetical protein BDV37DRAFT_285218 [Aspergillus pseudonomiae]
MDDDGSPTKTAPKFTRCRTGCLRCRKRRRKCDEGKPRCQNCIDKNLDCQYGLQVSFLQKNTFTVTASELRTPKPEVNYDKIKFVQEDPLGCTTDASVEDSPSPVASIPEAHTQSDPIVSTVVIAGERKDSDRRDNRDLDEHYGDGGSIHHDTLDLSHWDGSLNISPDGTPHQDKDDAVQGLLALGSTAGPNGIIPESTNLSLLSPNVTLSSLMNTRSSEVKDIPLPTVPTGLLDNPRRTSINGLSTSINTSISIESEARRLELLRHYRYHVATWLDICDLRHPFGINVIQMAMSSDKLLSVILALSETCIIQRGQWNRAGLEQLALRKSNQLDQLDYDHPDSTELILLYLLEDIRRLVTDVPKAWIHWVNRDVPFVNHLVQHAYSKNMESTAYWMFLRIDLGVALANDVPLRIPLPMLPIPSLSLLSRAEDGCERVSHYTNAVLWLCGKALALCHQEAMPHPLATSHEVMENWLQVFGELEQWQHLRPLEFEPMVEIDARDQVLNQGSEFPLLLFANGAGTFSNQIYHTAMLLLLQCKPRTALLNHPQSPVLSPLWHAYRICGIALNNDTRESWVPCLLASLLLAGKHMTHESQQEEILQGFDRIRGITGWDTGEYLSHLQEEWSFLDGL